MKLKTSISILGFIKYFLPSSALQALVPPNPCLFLHLSRILNFFNVSFSSSINRLTALSTYQKFVKIGSAQNLFSGFVFQSCVVDTNTAPEYNWQKFLLWTHYLKILFTYQINGKLKAKTIINFDHTPIFPSADKWPFPRGFY